MNEAPPSVDELKGRDLNPSMVAQETAPKPTWFVRRGSGKRAGEVIAVEEKEAWDMLNNTSSWKFKDFQFIGQSDGTTYQRVVKESLAAANKLAPEIEELKKTIARYRNQEDRILMDEVIDMEGDPSDTVNEAGKQKIIRLRGIVAREEDKLEKLEAAHRKATADVVKNATDAELKVAIENWKVKKVWPADDINILTPNATPRERQKIIAKMQG